MKTQYLLLLIIPVGVALVLIGLSACGASPQPTRHESGPYQEGSGTQTPAPQGSGYR